MKADLVNLIDALIEPGPFKGASFNCQWCGQQFLGTAAELAATKHRPGCAYQRAVTLLEVRDEVRESRRPAQGALL